MGDSLRTGKPPPCLTSHPGQLSLAIPLWVGTMSTGDGFRHHQGRNSEFCVDELPHNGRCCPYETFFLFFYATKSFLCPTPSFVLSQCLLLSDPTFSCYKISQFYLPMSGTEASFYMCIRPLNDTCDSYRRCLLYTSDAADE